MEARGQETMESLEAGVQELDFRSVVFQAEQHLGYGVVDTTGFRTPEGKYTNLALILSDMCPWHIEIRVSGETVKVLRGSIVRQLSEATKAVVATRCELAERRGVKLKQMQILVVQEAILNAVCHRSYCSGEPVVVDVEVCYVRVTSPGGQLRFWDGNMLNSRNPRLREFLMRLGFRHGTKHGFAWMMRAYDSCQVLPSVDFSPDRTVVTVPDMPDPGTVYEGRKCHIIKVLLSRSDVTNDVIREAILLSHADVVETVNRMESEGLVFMMPIAGRRIIFLTDRRHWCGRLEEHRTEHSARRADAEGGAPSPE